MDEYFNSSISITHKNHFATKKTKAIEHELEGDSKVSASMELFKESDAHEDLFKRTLGNLHNPSCEKCYACIQVPQCLMGACPSMKASQRIELLRTHEIIWVRCALKTTRESFTTIAIGKSAFSMLMSNAEPGSGNTRSSKHNCQFNKKQATTMKQRWCC